MGVGKDWNQRRITIYNLQNTVGLLPILTCPGSQNLTRSELGEGSLAREEIHTTGGEKLPVELLKTL